MDKKTLDLIRAHLEKAKEKLRASKNLLKNGDFDDAVSRAYYCAFHAAKAVLLTEGLTVQTHQGVVNLFGLHFAKTGRINRRYGKFLSNLKDDRENGDYEIYSAIEKADAVEAIQEAEEFLKAMEKFLKGISIF